MRRGGQTGQKRMCEKKRQQMDKLKECFTCTGAARALGTTGACFLTAWTAGRLTCGQDKKKMFKF